MFDVGFSELILLGIVALVVLGPEKLPHAARMAGAWLGRIRRTVIDIQAEIEKEVSAAELKQRMNDEIARLKAAAEPVTEEIQAVENTIHQHIHDASQTVDAAPALIESQTTTLNPSVAPHTTENPTDDIVTPSPLSTDDHTAVDKVNLVKS
ncbi:MAG TPA: Sec-independent protein translocase protein TatB [Agitococcus sp.]|nr:Sec-independent protein translocase protein TatB [Agitococcus sp.]HNI62918.1 Sec-independent protein translocase protein TatB [Agitococcus sp.]